jgi:hypothetical protein
VQLPNGLTQLCLQIEVSQPPTQRWAVTTNLFVWHVACRKSVFQVLHLEGQRKSVKKKLGWSTLTIFLQIPPCFHNLQDSAMLNHVEGLFFREKGARPRFQYIETRTTVYSIQNLSSQAPKLQNTTPNIFATNRKDNTQPGVLRGNSTHHYTAT